MSQIIHTTTYTLLSMMVRIMIRFSQDNLTKGFSQATHIIFQQSNLSCLPVCEIDFTILILE